MQITGAQLFVKALQAEQVDTLFAIPAARQSIYSMHCMEPLYPRLSCPAMNRVWYTLRTAMRVLPGKQEYVW